MIEQTVSIERMEDAIDIFGSFDENIRIIEQELAVRVVSRDDQLKISGEAENVLYAVKAVQGLLGLAQTLHRGQGGAAVHLDPLPPDGVGADGLVEEQRVGAQTAQVKGLPLLLNEFGQAGGQVRQHPLAKRQVRVVIGHGMDQRLLAQRGDIALLTIL